MYTEENNPEAEQHLFAEEDLFNYHEASVGQRFLNLLIDFLVMRFGLSRITAPLFVKFLVAVAPDTAYEIFGDVRQHAGAFLLAAYMISMFNFLVYYTFCEIAFKGYTLGKFVTGTRAIRQDGRDLTFSNALLRSLSRLVPFEAFSAFGGHPWHDQWTKTMVVKAR
jgi:uncharacterized RDD family membrane protein YckC